MKSLLCLVVAISMCVSISAAHQRSITRLDGSTITMAQIDKTVIELMKAGEVTGAAITIFNGGKPVYLQAYGFRDTSKNLPLTVNSVMSAASFSKVAFAVLAMRLVDDGKLDLDRPVYKYLPKPLPEYERYTDLASDPRYKRITARMILSHTTGFPNWRFLEEDGKLKIHFEPGSKYAYSGEGIDLLQLVIETITQKSLTELMDDRVFKPFGMSSTSMVWQSRFENDFANGYNEQGRSLGPERWPSPDAAGSMQTTIADFSRFLQNVASGKMLSPKTSNEMLHPQIEIFSRYQFPTLQTDTTDANKSIRLSYGLGWGLYSTPYGEAFFKEGHDDGWRHYMVYFEKPGIGLVIMTNSSNGEGIFQYLLERLLSNPYTPIEWEGYTPYDKLPRR